MYEKAEMRDEVDKGERGVGMLRFLVCLMMMVFVSFFTGGTEVEEKGWEYVGGDVYLRKS